MQDSKLGGMNMRVRNFEIDKDFLLRIASMSLAMIIGSGIGTALRHYKNEQDAIKNAQNNTTHVEYFDEGEHVIAVSIENPAKKVKEYPYHIGYYPAGITSTGDSSYILYKNDCQVVVTSTSKNDQGEYVYESFGVPVEYELGNYEDREYAPGEHIISVPYKGTGNIIQMENHEGYEVVGMTKVSTLSTKTNGCILYVNTENVTKTSDKPEFGQVTEKEKVLEK